MALSLTSVTSLLHAVLNIISLPFIKLWEQINILRHGSKIPGRPALPLVGNILELGRDSEAVYRYVEDNYYKFGNIFRVYVGPLLAVCNANAVDLEKFLSGHEYLGKGMLYKFLKPWLGSGLLLSTGDKWRSRRKILTPAFHFKILDQFLPVFNSCGDEFVQQMRKTGGKPVDVWLKSKLLTLDVICETTMGVKVNAQTNSESTYVNAVNEMSKLIYEYVLRPWLYPSFIFRFSSLGRRFNACLEILHGMTNKVIKERKDELQKLENWETATEVDDLGRKKRVAFLDLLLMAARDGSLSDSDIREEVDTFMFEGHDTTASAIAFTLYLLSHHTDVQDKMYEELKEVFDTSKPLEPTLQQISELKYTEMVIKETMRIYPPVPGLSREITSDFKVPSNGLVIPKGSELFASPIMLHRDPNIYPDPETFDPERFSPEECARRHPFAYLPFSAGPRNCIGQKFAMLEMKNIIAKVVWNFRLKADPDYTPIYVWELILKTKNGIFVKMEERQKQESS